MHESKLEVTKSVSHVKMEEMVPRVSSTLNAYVESSGPDHLEHQHSFIRAFSILLLDLNHMNMFP